MVHSETSKTEKMVNCNFCPKSMRKDYVKAHNNCPGAVNKESKKESQINLKCVHCGKSFDNKGGLRWHVFQYHKSLTKCKLCEKRFATKFGLMRHIAKAHNSNKLDFAYFY